MSTETTTRKPFPPAETADEHGFFPCDCGNGFLRYVEKVDQMRGRVIIKDGHVWIDSEIDRTGEECYDEWLECNYCCTEYQLPSEYDWS